MLNVANIVVAFKQERPNMFVTDAGMILIRGVCIHRRDRWQVDNFIGQSNVPLGSAFEPTQHNANRSCFDLGGNQSRWLDSASAVLVYGLEGEPFIATQQYFMEAFCDPAIRLKER